MAGPRSQPSSACSSPFPNCLLPHSHGNSFLGSTYLVSTPQPSPPCRLDPQPPSHADIRPLPGPLLVSPWPPAFPVDPTCPFSQPLLTSLYPLECGPGAGCPQRVSETPHEAPRPAAQAEKGRGWGLQVSHSGVSSPHSPIPEVEQVRHGGGGPLGPRGAGDLGLGSWLGTCPVWPA